MAPLRHIWRLVWRHMLWERKREAHSLKLWLLRNSRTYSSWGGVYGIVRSKFFLKRFVRNQVKRFWEVGINCIDLLCILSISQNNRDKKDEVCWRRTAGQIRVLLVTQNILHFSAQVIHHLWFKQFHWTRKDKYAAIVSYVRTSAWLEQWCYVNDYPIQRKIRSL